MSVTGLCEICTTGTVEHTCDRCGRLVCTEHFDETTGWCVECVADGKHPRPGPEPNRPDETDTYQF